MQFFSVTDASLQNKTYEIKSTQGKVDASVPFELPQKLKLQDGRTCKAEKAAETFNLNYSDENLHDPDLFLYNFALSDATVPGSKKDPFHLNPLLCEAILNKYEADFTKWLNSVLTPPEELGTEDVIKVNAADLWARSTRTGAAELLAPSREVVTFRYLSVKVRNF
jgi:hypothetical protein